MSSSAQIVTRAMRRLRLLDANEEPTADDAEHGLAALNAMIAGWQGDGVDVSSDTPLEARFEEGIVALLAVRLADDFGATPSQVVVRDSDVGWRRLKAAYCPVPTAQIDTALTNMPSQRLWASLGLPELWKPATAYSAADRVQWNGRIYECTTGGTSDDITGPMSRDAAITDGTAVWQYVEMV